ncbi:MAG: caspase family protein [Magnetococcales bacterium]|nr:caspase family protein [Magnetococcales bacterium]MBF0437575.1 caspase family protein [Magnetococcales bacterium]
MSHSFAFLSALLSLLLLFGSGNAEASQSNPCVVAREIETKAIALLDAKPDEALKAFQNAQTICTADVVIGFNLGLALYQTGKKKQAMETWENLHESFPNHEKTLANLAWLKFELGDDKKAYRLASEGFNQHPGNLSMAHTKLFTLFRKGDYLEAYDWIMRMRSQEQDEAGTGLKGDQVDRWQEMASKFVTETLWRQFRKGDRMDSLRQSINLLVKEYPTETRFVQTKDQLLLAYTDPEAETPYPLPLPHEVWPKSGDIDTQDAMLDNTITAMPVLASWQKRGDAFAVVAGISHYKRIKARHFADRDATNIHHLLTRRGVFMADVDHIRLRVNAAADRQTLQQDLDWLVKQGELNPNASLLFYFSGLGYPTATDALLLPVDAQLNALDADHAISIARLNGALSRLPNKEIVVLLDVCFNNTPTCAVQPDQPNLVAKRSLFLQGKPMAVASEKKGAALHGPGQQGAFTWFLLKGLLGDADGFPAGKKDGWVNLTEAFDYLKVKLSQHTPPSDPILALPTPMRLTRTGGEQ